MDLNIKDIKFEAITGQGPGGQLRNRRHKTIRATHIPSGIVRIAGSRSQAQNKKDVVKMIQKELDKRQEAARGAKRKAARDAKIKDKRYIRTYDYKARRVKDHRTGKTANPSCGLRRGCRK